MMRNTEGESSMKKFIDLLAISSLVAVLLTGCGPTRITVDEDENSKVSDSVVYVTPVETED